MQYIDTESILGYPITLNNKDSCVDIIASWLEDQESSRYFVCANPHSIQVAKDDMVFHRALLGADLITPDGIGMVIASKMLGGGLNDRVTGSDVFWGLNEKLNAIGGKRCFFLGSTEEVLEQIKIKMAAEYPNIILAGTHSPPFKPEFCAEDNRKMCELINEAKPDVLWVGMTAPKQEKWIYENRAALDVRFIGAIGAVFDFYVGRVKRSHPAFQRVGLEWLPRLLQEPRRLWRRNFVSNPAFLFRVVQEKVK